MKKYKSREVVYAEQYFAGKEIKGVKIGKNDPENRWDDTPDGQYIQGEEYKYRVKEGDWIVKKDDDSFLSVYPDAEFKRMYELKKSK